MKIVYASKLKSLSQKLRNQMTETEVILWQSIRKKQIANIQFYRQRPFKQFVLDFYAPSIKLAIEIDGSQHFTEKYKIKDDTRDRELAKVGVRTLRFTTIEILCELDSVLQEIYNQIIKTKRFSDRDEEKCHN